MNKKQIYIFGIIILAYVITAIHGCTRPPKQLVQEEVILDNRPTMVNIFVENSGSMKGFFAGNSQIKDIIKEYYDRIGERQKDSDTITLNYINTQIENYSDNIKNYLAHTQSKCTASYSKVDNILTLAMEGCNDTTVNVVVSDYCFESNDGSLAMAASGITSLFSKQMRSNSSLSVAIIKYMSDFKGRYFPGGINCNKPLPFYIWIFGNAADVKQIANLPIKEGNCGKLLLQPKQFINHRIISKNARMIDGDAIIVKKWNPNRGRGFLCSRTDDSDEYIVNIEVDLNSVILSEGEIVNKQNYKISDGYTINSIKREKDNKYVFTISTPKPSPGLIMIDYSLDSLPQWVEDSNFAGVGIPKDSTTLGIKDLITGVYEAYHNNSKEYFTIKVILK